MKKFLLFTFLTLNVTAVLSAQCSFFVTAEADEEKICAPGGLVTLTGDTDASNIIEQFWGPAGAVNNPNSQVTTANVTGTTLFTYSVTAQSTDNLIDNGDFEAGHTGFTSDYNYLPPTFNPAGFNGQNYTVITIPQLVSNGFPSCDDHTFMNGTGTLMLVNSRLTTGIDFWCQTVNINPNSDYVFSMWIGGVLFLAPELDVTINGDFLGTGNALGGVCNWNEFTETWVNPGGVTSIEICISVRNADLFGPVFALDDIALYEICTDTDEVLVEMIEVESIIEPPMIIDCKNEEITLDGTDSSFGSNITYEWTTPDGFIVGPEDQNTAIAGAEGEYILTVTYDDGDVTCTDVTSVMVEEDKEYPTASAEVDSILNCRNPSVELDGSGSTQGFNISYLWTTFDGIITSGSTTLTPTVIESGDYQILVTNNDNGCQDSMTVFVDQDFSAPTARIATPDSLGCNVPVITLDGSGSSIDPSTAIFWGTSNGNIVGQTNLPTAQVDTVGDYFLVITDNTNGCFDTAKVVVVGDDNLPVIDILPVDSLTCKNQLVTIDASGSSHDSIYQFQWWTLNGSFVSGDSTLTPTVDSIGDYYFSVIDTVTMCADTAQITITQDTLFPEITAGAPQTFLCSDDSIQLNAIVSNPDTNFVFIWSSISGNISSGQFSLNPWVGSPGSFLVFATDTTNGCQSVDTAKVVPDNDLPVVQIASPDSLTCIADEIQLDASASDSGNDILFNWSTPNGSFSGPTTNYMPIVNAPGTYELLLQDTSNGCENRASVEVFENRDTPDVFITLPDTITCTDKQVTLSSFVTGSNSNLTFNWSTVNGAILGSSSDISAVVNEPGTYFLDASNDLNGCIRSVQTQVFEKKIFPDVSVAPPDTINCINPEIDLMASVSNSEGIFTFIWQEFPDGNIVGANDQATIRVDSAGTYLVRGVETTTGCLSERLVDVEENFAFPLLTVLAFDSLNCKNDSIKIEGIAQSSSSNLNYSWTTTDGNILGATNDFSIFANQPGSYLWEVVDVKSGCVSDTTVSLGENRNLPSIQIELPDTLSCSLTPIFLNAAGSSTGSNFDLDWTTFTGNILTGNNTFTPEINAPGTYYFNIINSSNGCETMDSVQVAANSSLTGLSISLNGSDTLNCRQTQLEATVTPSLPGNITYDWTGTLTPNSSPTSVIETPGIITVQVTDETGCSGHASVEVFSDFAEPIADAGVSQQLSCSVDSLILNGSGSLGTNFLPNWTTSTGNIRSGENTFAPTVGTQGWYFLTVENLQNGCTKTDSVEVTASTDLPFGFIQPPLIWNCIQQSFELDANTSDSGPGIEYQWTTIAGNIVSGSTGLSPTIDQPGTYFLEILNTGNSCKTTLNTEVVADTIRPDVNAGTDTLINCFNSQISLNASVNSPRTDFRYDWQTIDGNILQNANTNQPEINSGGNYALTVTDLINGCENTTSVNVVEDFSKPLGTPLPSDNLTCSDTIIDLSVQLPDDDSNYEFIWSTNNGRFVINGDTSTVNVDVGGDFRVEIIQLSNGCRDTVDLQVTESKQLPEIMVNNSLSITCKDSTVTISGVGSATGFGISYGWTTLNGQIISGQNSIDAIAGSEGIYTFTVSDSNTGCKDTASVQVSLDTIRPTIVFVAPDTLTCSQSEITLTGNILNGNNSNINWTTDIGNIISGANSNQISLNRPGIYILSVENVDNGCSSQDSIEIFQNSNQPIVQIETPEALTCNQEEIQLNALNSTAGGQVSFNWSTTSGNIVSGANGLNPIVDNSGFYTLTIRNIFTGCEGKDSIEVLEIPNTLTDIMLSGINPGCVNPTGSIQVEEVFGGIGPFEFSIDNGSNFSDENLFENLTEGNYRITVRDSNGCILNSAIDLVRPDSLQLLDLPDINMAQGAERQILVTVNRDSTELELIEWSPNIDLSCDNCLNPTLTSSGSQTYTLFVRDIYGCEATIDFSVETSAEIDIFFPTGFSPNNDTYNDLFKGYAAPGVISNIKTLRVFDRWGNLLYQGDNGDPNDSNFGWDGTFKGKKMDPGVYVFFAELELFTGETVVMKGDVTIMGNN